MELVLEGYTAEVGLEVGLEAGPCNPWACSLPEGLPLRATMVADRAAMDAVRSASAAARSFLCSLVPCRNS